MIDTSIKSEISWPINVPIIKTIQIIMRKLYPGGIWFIKISVLKPNKLFLVIKISDIPIYF